MREYIQQLKNPLLKYYQELILISILPAAYLLAGKIGIEIIAIIAPDIDIFDSGCGKSDVELKEYLHFTSILNAWLSIIYLAQLIKINYRILMANMILFYVYAIFALGNKEQDIWTLITDVGHIIFAIIILFPIIVIYLVRKRLDNIGFVSTQKPLIQSVVYLTIIVIVSGILLGLYSISSQPMLEEYFIIWTGLIIGIIFKIRIQCLRYLFPMVGVGLLTAYITGIINYFYPYLPQPGWSVDFIYLLFYQCMLIISPIIFNEIVRALINRIVDKTVFEKIA